MTMNKQDDKSPYQASAVPSHALYVELATRISTQALHYRSGNEETAAESLHSLFATTRKLMVDHPKAVQFNEAALVLLNDILRPYTARWHGWMCEDRKSSGSDGKPTLRFRDEWVRRKFREELQELQPLLHGAVMYLQALSLGEQPDTKWLNPQIDSEEYSVFNTECGGTVPQAYLGATIPLKIRPQVPNHGTNEKGLDPNQEIACDIERAESSFIEGRRKAMGFDSSRIENTVGLALSGGGIRSATFCLGVVQSLHRHGLFNQVDYLSTVSGGGYLGTFLSSFLGTKANTETNSSTTNKFRDGEVASGGESLPDRVNGVLGRHNDLAEPAPIRHLRNNSKYLLNGGGWGMLRFVGVFISGFLASLLMLLTIPLLVAWGALAVKVLSETKPFSAIKLPWENLPAILNKPGGTILAFMFLTLAFFWLAKLFAQRLAEGKPWESRWAKWRGFFENGFLYIGVATFMIFGLCGSYFIVDEYEHTREGLAGMVPSIPEWLGGVLAAIPAIVTGALSKRKDGSSRKWAEALFYLTGPLFFLLTFLIFSSNLGVGQQGQEGNLLVWGTITTALLIWAFLCININTFAPHRYYRDRLCECYLAIPGKPQRTLSERGIDSLLHGACTIRNEAATAVGAVKSLPLTSIAASPAAPYHLINAVLNAEAAKNPNLRGRNGDFFLFSRHYCGCPLTGYITTEDMEKANPDLDLGTAMAISGAALSTNMGSKTLRRMRFLLTLFNVRLGYWMRRPGSGAWPRLIHGPGPMYFLREMLGAVHERTRYINLSDGGHIENLATYELLRRQCKFIVCVDAGMDAGMECADLMRLQRLAEIDFGIRLHFDPSDLSLLPTRYSRAYATLVKIDYAPNKAAPSRKTSDDLGWMLYLKLAVTGTEPRHVLDYRRQNPDFPHQTTGDQFYDEAQFESYRALGECAAESLFREEITGKVHSDQLKIDEWFQHLANSLLADNDEVFNKSQSHTHNSTP